MVARSEAEESDDGSARVQCARLRGAFLSPYVVHYMEFYHSNVPFSPDTLSASCEQVFVVDCE